MFKAIWRLFSNIFRRQSRRVNEAADAVYTGSASGISDAFDDAQDSLIKDYKQLEGAVAQVLSGVEQQRQQLEDLNTREEDLIKKRDGALQLAMDEPENRASHQAAFERFHTQITEIEREQANLQAFIDTQEGQLSELEEQLKEMQRELDRLPAEKAKEIAAYVSAQKLIDAYDRINGLKTSYDRGPLDAVRKQNRDLTARATVKRRMAGVDAKAEDARYASAGVETTASNAFEAMLAQRKADKADRTGVPTTEAPVAESSDGDGGRQEF